MGEIKNRLTKVFQRDSLRRRTQAMVHTAPLGLVPERDLEAALCPRHPQRRLLVARSQWESSQDPAPGILVVCQVVIGTPRAGAPRTSRSTGWEPPGARLLLHVCLIEVCAGGGMAVVITPQQAWVATVNLQPGQTSSTPIYPKGPWSCAGTSLAQVRSHNE